MKQFIINIQDLIRRGILRIFPKNVPGGHYSEAVINRGHRPRIMTRALSAAWKAVPCIFLLLLLLGCSTQRHLTTQLVEHTSIDTIYLSNVQYDSIYIYQDKLIDRSRDTLYIKDKSIEYRYRLLKDTIRVVERDSIPYQVTITEVKEITRPLTFYDHLTRTVFWLVIGLLVTTIVYKLRTVFKR